MILKILISVCIVVSIFIIIIPWNLRLQLLLGRDIGWALGGVSPVLAEFCTDAL